MDRPVALITGAARRVGRAIALHLARQGCDIAFTYHQSADSAAALVAELQSLGAGTCAIQADLTDLPASIERILAELDAFRPTLSVLVNNASIYKPDSNDATEAMQMWQVNLHAPLLLSRSLSAKLKPSGGCVINLCDIMGNRPMPGWLTYCASKAALASLTVGLARELAPQARCCGIAPGVVEWPADFSEEDKQKYLERVPLHRAGTPEDVARLVHFLATQGTYITGQIITLDGGRSIA